jgi:hypothetical protein
VKAVNGTNFFATLAKWKLGRFAHYRLFVAGYFYRKFLNMILHSIQALILSTISCAFVLIATALVIAALPVR